MTKTITKTYQSIDTLVNVRQDLVGTGIERELIYLDKDKKQVKVTILATIEPEIQEILRRHQPID